MKFTPVTMGSGIPTSLEMITPHLLSQDLQHEVRAVSLLNDHIGDGMTGSLVQLALEYGPDRGNLPPTMVAKLSSFDKKTRDASNFLSVYEWEVYFYQHLARRSGIRTPHCYYAAFDPDLGRSLLLLEDLSGYHHEDLTRGCALPRTKAAIQEMARLHAFWWNHPDLEKIPWPEFQVKWLLEKFEKYWDDFKVFLQLDQSPSVARIGELVKGSFISRVRELLSPPLTLIHNDFHLDNLLFEPGEGSTQVVVLDWALFSRARGGFDLARFIVSSLTPSDRRAHERSLLQTYLDGLVQGGVKGYTPDRCLRDFQNATLYYLTRFVAAQGGALDEVKQGKPLAPGKFQKMATLFERNRLIVQDHFNI